MDLLPPEIIVKITRELSEKEIKELALAWRPLPRLILQTYPLEITYSLCQSLSIENARDLLLNPSVDQKKLLKCGIRRGWVRVIDSILKKVEITPRESERLLEISIIHLQEEVLDFLLKMDQGPLFDPSYDQNILLSTAAATGYIPTTQRLLQDSRVDPSDRRSESIVVAAQEGNIEVVRLLLKDGRADPTVQNYLPVREAIRHGERAIVILFLRDERVEPNDKLLLSAAKHDRPEIITLLLDYDLDPSVRNNRAIYLAAKEGSSKVLGTLLSDSRVNPGDQNNRALLIAVSEGHLAVVNALLGDSRVIPTPEQSQMALADSIRFGEEDIFRALWSSLKITVPTFEKALALLQLAEIFKASPRVKNLIRRRMKELE